MFYFNNLMSSYWYNFDANNWSAVYKHTHGKDLKFKAGYDSEVRLGWASLWVSHSIFSILLFWETGMLFVLPPDNICDAWLNKTCPALFWLKLLAFYCISMSCDGAISCMFSIILS